MPTTALYSFLGLFCLGAVVCAAGFEAKPAPCQTVPRPADGETVNANPPCFVYPASKNCESYVVEVSRDRAFPADATMQFTSPYMLFAPGEALKPGAYHWRWRPGRPDDGAGEWSRVRAFTVPVDAPVLPFPDIDSLVKQIGKSRPRVQVTASGLAEMRKHALTVFGEHWLDEVRSYAEHARDQALLPEPDFLPDRKDPHRKELYQKTFRTTRPFFRQMARLAQDYLLTGNKLSGLEAKRRLLHIIHWDPCGSTSLGHNDEPGTEVVRYCPTVMDRVYSLLTDEEKRRCIECLTLRMQEMRNRWKRRPFEKYPYESHNMGYYLPDMLEASLAMVGDAPVEEMLRYTMLQLWSPFYPPFGGADGGWSEGPNYGSWSSAVFARAYRLVERTTGVPIHLRSNLRNFSLYKLYDNPPYFKMSPFGDGQAGHAGGGATMMMLAALYHDPYAKWYAEQQKARLYGLDRLLFDASKIEAKAPYDLPQGRGFFDVGLATMHTVLPDPARNVAVLMRSCPFGSISHAYADQNTFVLDAYGEPLIIASGYYQLYGCPHHAEWTWQTKASNSVLVNGEGQSTRDWNAKGRLATFQTTVAGDYAVGDAKQAYKGRLDRFNRRIVFLRPLHTGGEPLVVIRDELAAPKPATYQFLLHALNQMEVNATEQRITIAKGASRCRVDYLAPKGLTFDQNNHFTKPPIRKAPDQWHLTASTVEPAAAADSLIAIQPYRKGEADGLLSLRKEKGQGGIGLTLSGPDRTIIVLFRTDPSAKTITLGKISTDADAASVCVVEGKVRSAVLFKGTELTYGQTTVLKGSASAAVSASECGGRRLVSSDAPRGTQFAARLGQENRWTQTAGSWVSAFAGEDVPAPKPLEMDGQPPVPFTVTRCDGVQRIIAQARVPGVAAHYEAQVIVGNVGKGRLPVSLTAGPSTVQQTLAPMQQEARLVLPAVNLGGGKELVVAADEATGGQVAVRQATVRRAYGVNLLPNGSFEQVEDGKPVDWRAVSITKKAQARIESRPGGRNGGRCAKVTCTEATGGTFGAMLTWPGVQPSEIDRMFRMSCWVKTDATSAAGLQVTSADWKWYKITKKLKGQADWAETSLEFVLPAGENITHARLHMDAEKTGAELFVDDVSLVELAP
ncbi:MAG: DUF4962 domain-containing protein [Planctomycetes bacterium]|nr:DUF4962 domain-containing protein [Planctomycetota bacterium]